MLGEPRSILSDSDIRIFLGMSQEISYFVEQDPSRSLKIHHRDEWDAHAVDGGKGAVKFNNLYFYAYSRTMQEKLRLFA